MTARLRLPALEGDAELDAMLAPVTPLIPASDARRALAERAVGRLPDLGAEWAETIGYGLTRSATTTQRIDALCALGWYAAEQNIAAARQLTEVAEDTVSGVEDVLASLTGLHAVETGVTWGQLVDDAEEALYLEALAARGQTPKYAQPLDGPPITGFAAQRARDREIASRREGMRIAAVHLVGLVGRRPGVAR